MLILIFSLFPLVADAGLELSVIRPLGEFVTNNSELVIEGVVKYSKAQQVAVSVNTPAGVPSLSSLSSLRSLTVDVGSVQSLTALIFTPTFEEGLSFGPRVVSLLSSEDGQNFEDKGTFNCTSGMGQEFREARVDFPETFQCRFVRIDMLDGWQSNRISVQEVAFEDTAMKVVRARIRGITVALNVGETADTHFWLTILLREGENQISLSAEEIIPSASPTEIGRDSVTLLVNYIPEVDVEKVVTLSDGYKARLTIPASALSANVKKINISPLKVDEIEWASYADNTQIVKGTLPVSAYKIEVSAQTPFPVSAKDSLKRQPPELAVDGDPEYPSTWITALSPLPVWFKIDLRTPRTIGRIDIVSRTAGNISYGPKRLSVLVSNDDISFYEVATCDECDSSRISLTLPSTPSARFVKLVIDEGRQGNNIQINEVELWDGEGTKIVLYTQLKSIALSRVAELTLAYDDLDLASAGVRDEKNLAIFSWSESTNEWIRVGGKVDTAKDMVTVCLNFLSTFAIFESPPSSIKVHWSHNPFSPNNDGIADTTTISIDLGETAVSRAKVEIFDYTGKLVRTLVFEETSSLPLSITWDGKDEHGDWVEIGPYIYQVSVGRKTRNGVLIVAR